MQLFVRTSECALLCGLACMEACGPPHPARPALLTTSSAAHTCPSLTHAAPPLTHSLADRTHVVETQPDCTVADVKAIIQAREGVCVCWLGLCIHSCVEKEVGCCCRHREFQGRWRSGGSPCFNSSAPCLHHPLPAVSCLPA